MKPSSPVARPKATPLTPEEEKEQFMRAYMQKKASLAEGILFNMAQGTGYAITKDEGEHLKMVHMADEMATEFMKVVYRQDIRVKEGDE